MTVERVENRFGLIRVNPPDFGPFRVLGAKLLLPPQFHCFPKKLEIFIDFRMLEIVLCLRCYRGQSWEVAKLGWL